MSNEVDEAKYEEIFDEEYLICRLQDTVNSAMLTFKNHTQDNGFFWDTPREVINSMNMKKYEPIGICTNIPFECSSSSMSIAFVFRDRDVVVWCHMPETYWFHLLSEYYGRTQADAIFEEVLCKNRKDPRNIKK